MCCGMIGTIADGEAEVRKAAREQLRRDVDQIKIMASGGAMSPSDELDTTQFTVAEMRAAVEEAQAVGKYVLSHAYSDTAVRRAIEAGVRSIEHGNLIRETAAKAIKDADAFLVPTMVTYEAIYREGKRYGIGDHQIAKIDMARQQSVQGLTYAYKAGCKIGSGSDLLGDTLWLEKPTRYRPPKVARAPRIGVDYAGDWALKPWRFFDRNSPYVSTVSAAARRKALKSA